VARLISEAIPNPEDLLALAPEELAGVLMEILNSMSAEEQRARLNPAIICGEFGIQGYPNQLSDPVSLALMEAWVWLEREGFLARRPGDFSLNYYFVTRRGKRTRGATDLAAYRQASVLPVASLHPIIAQKVSSAFLRGEYETAIFQAYKELEVAVRDAGGFAPTDIGTDLMRKAFNKDNGPLTDMTLPDAEREATAHVFAGAIGLFKNPHSHRNVPVTDPREAASVIGLASFLMGIVDRAKPSTP
jgi:uncharacterized protein (TIGR02391 family)